MCECAHQHSGVATLPLSVGRRYMLLLDVGLELGYLAQRFVGVESIALF
jgi:hypothetical protein